MNALHAFVVILRSLTVRLGEVSCESITCSRRCGCYGHRRSKGCINSICATCAVLLVKRYGYGVSNPSCIKCSVFCLIPNFYACHGAIVILNAFCIIVTIEGISGIRIRRGSFRHSRVIYGSCGVRTACRTILIKGYGVRVSFPFSIKRDNVTLRSGKIKNCVRIIIRCACTVCICGPANEGVSNSCKNVRGQALSLVVFKALICHRAGCRGCVLIELYGVRNRSPLCVNIQISRATRGDNGNLGSGIKSVACIPTAEDVTFTSGIFQINVSRVYIITIEICACVLTTVQMISDVISIVIPICNVFFVSDATGVNDHRHSRSAYICSCPPKESIAYSCRSC